jgi:SEC-C motif-containing protein
MAESQTAIMKPGPGENCPCGSGKAFGECCDAILTGKRPAATAEQLMRARYTAHVVHDFEFLHRTFRETALLPYVEVPAPPATTWTRLVVHAHEPGRSPETAYVDFSAYGTDQGAGQVLHEKAEFVRQDGAWIYTRAVREGPAPFKATVPKPGRNDPCPCGSGKKYKHCCLLKA